jgi:hypothetical protein
MTDHQPPSFPRLSESADDAATRPEPTGSLFSRSGAAADEMAVADTPVVVTPTAAPSSMTMNSRWRWAVVGVATVLVVGLLGAVFVLAGPRAGTPSTVARYAPADTATYLELRQDLPGDQHNLLATFMSHFPGFADQAAFDQKLDETLDSLLGAGQSGVSWQNDIKPWFGGQIGLFGATVAPSQGTAASMTVALTVKAGQRSALDSWLTPLLGTDWQQTTYQGQTVWTGVLAGSRERVSLAPTDEVLLVGTRIEDVQAALDVRADRANGLADDQFFLAQLAALHADRLGMFYLDGRGMADALRSQIGSELPNASMLDWVFNAAAVRVLGEVRAEGNHLAITTRSERSTSADLPPLPANRTTNLADLAPRDALVYAEVRDVGQMLSFAIERLLAPAASAAGAPLDLSNLQELLGTPPQDFFDFIVDASMSVSGSNGKFDFGLIASVDDNAIAKARVDKLMALLHMLTQFGGGVTLAEQQHGAATITVLTVSGPPGSPTDMSFAISLTAGRLLVGTTDFVVGALDRTRDQSLAARPEYEAALQAGGSANAGVMFVDINAARTAFESLVPPNMRGSYDQNQLPFLEPLSHLAMITTIDNGVAVNHIFLYVK